MEMLVPPLPWHRPTLREADGPLVVLLHGLWRSRHAMEPLARRLHAAGFATLNLPYPSTRLPIPELATRLRSVVDFAADGRETCWVTHSLGGIVARALLADGAKPPRRMIMMAPPNQGSEIVDRLARVPSALRLLGPAGRQLGTGGAPCQLPPPPPEVETLVIMGDRSGIPIFRAILGGANDGIVSVERGRLPSPHRFEVVDADHTFISVHPDTISHCISFLKGDASAATNRSTAS